MKRASETRLLGDKNNSHLGAQDGVVLGALFLVLGAYLLTGTTLPRHPEEDAAILLRYSKHLAEGHGIVWNVGEAPVDGATDFAFMILVAALYRAGLSLESAAWAIGLAAHALTVTGVFVAVRVLFGGSRWMAFLSGAYLAVGLGLRYVAASYGTPLFALTACLAWYLANRLVQEELGGLARASLLFSLSAVVMGLARPEGVFLALFMLLSVLYARGGHGSRTVLALFMGLFVLIGLTYFLWRWSYFGHPLPNPFYKKGGGVLHFPVVVRAFRDLFRLGGPFLLLILAGLFSAKARVHSVFVLITLLGFALVWVLISDETNYFMRFRYPALPLILISWVPVWQRLIEGSRAAAGSPRTPGARVLIRGLALLVLATVVFYQHTRYRHIEPRRVGLYDVAMMLREYRAKGYTLATTEAGLLPLYSEWKAIDAWGLNDPWIAHHGLITESYLETRRPELIMFHAYFSPGISERDEVADKRGLRSWSRMVTTLKDYAEANGYLLAAAFVKDAYDSHYYYVRRGFPEATEIATRIRFVDYYWDGEPRANGAPGS